MKELWSKIWYQNSQERESSQRVIIRSAVSIIIDGIASADNNGYIQRIGFVNSNDANAKIDNNNFQNDNSKQQTFENSLGNKKCYIVRIVVNCNQSENWEIFNLFKNEVQNKKWTPKNYESNLNDILKKYKAIINFEIYSIMADGFRHLWIDNEQINMFDKLGESIVRHPSFPIQKVIDGINGGIDREFSSNSTNRYERLYSYLEKKKG
ncbi:MAG: hypothetical protein ACI4F4_09600 [Lachnospiraceae bacterium]